jgi:hypothetical protein
LPGRARGLPTGVTFAQLTRFALLLIAILPLARGADVAIDDLRIEYSPLLGRNWRMSGMLDDDAPGAGVAIHSNYGSTQTVESHRRFGLGYYRSLGPLEADRGAFLVGAALSSDRTETIGHSRGTAWILDGFAGFAWAFTPEWHIEEGVIVGGGRDRWDLHFHSWFFDGSDWLVSDTALIYEYGLRLGTTYTVARHAQAALDLRYLVSDARLNLSTSYASGGITETVSYRPRVRTEGLGGAFALGWRF